MECRRITFGFKQIAFHGRQGHRKRRPGPHPFFDSLDFRDTEKSGPLAPLGDQSNLGANSD
jgi:hypothetical protein